MKRSFALFWWIAVLPGSVCLGQSLSPSKAPKVQVFVLAGQSNMEGHGQLRSLGHVLEVPGYDRLLDALRAKGPLGDAARTDTWATREDVTIAWREHSPSHGPLGVGWGASENEIGPELMFGTVVGNTLDAPVLLIKTAYGGKDVFCDFRSPSAGPPKGAAREVLDREKASEPDQEPREVGLYYQRMLRDIGATLADLEHIVPGNQGQGYELAGFAWFQGWNDFCRFWEAPGLIDQYPSHLAAMFRDLRKDLKAPNLRIAIGELGIGGIEMERRASNPEDLEAGAMVAFRRAQKSVADDPTLRHVTFVPTAAFWDERLEILRAQVDAYAQEKESKGIPSTDANDLPDPVLNLEYRRRGGQWYCHYNGSAATYCLVGNALAQALLAD